MNLYRNKATKGNQLQTTKTTIGKVDSCLNYRR